MRQECMQSKSFQSWSILIKRVQELLWWSQRVTWRCWERRLEYADKERHENVAIKESEQSTTSVLVTAIRMCQKCMQSKNFQSWSILIKRVQELLRRRSQRVTWRRWKRRLEYADKERHDNQRIRTIDDISASYCNTHASRMHVIKEFSILSWSILVKRAQKLLWRS